MVLLPIDAVADIGRDSEGCKRRRFERFQVLDGERILRALVRQRLNVSGLLLKRACLFTCGCGDDEYGVTVVPGALWACVRQGDTCCSRVHVQFSEAPLA